MFIIFNKEWLINLLRCNETVKETYYILMYFIKFIHNWRTLRVIKMSNKILLSHFFRTVTLAYINIGLIYLLHLDNYTEAIRYFSEALKLDPSYIQSYICQAEAYHKVFKD